MNTHPHKSFRSESHPVRSPSPEKHPAAFTLIEMLVVLAIFTLLASLLVPAVSRARERANLTKCAHQMRQWGTAFYLYAADNDGDLPTHVGNFWQEEIAPYMVSHGTPGQLRHILRAKYACPNDRKTFDSWAYGTSNYFHPVMYAPAPKKLHSLANSTRQMLLVETETSGVWSLIPTQGQNGAGIFYNRHKGKANFLFADNHIETLTHEQAIEKVIVRPDP